MWQALQAGWTPPDHVSQQEYDALKTANSSALRGFVGYGCSFGGKWFGGYARSRNGAAPNYNYAAGAVRSVLKTASAIKHANICQQDYRTVHVAPWAVVYADPPYIGTQGYGSDFDTEEFWTVADRWADTGALVLVSEHVAPPGWDLVWSKGLPNYLNGTEQVSGARTECLFIRKDQKEIRA